MKTIAVLQSNYIPWKGYFDIIAAVDEFVVYDDTQYTRRDWRNRNQIKTPQGTQWLTVPVQSRGNYFQPIREVRIDGRDWAERHWRALTLNYSKAPYWNEVAAWLRPFYVDRSYQRLSQLNMALIRAICTFLGITTHISCSSQYDTSMLDASARLAHLCHQASATKYITGPSARTYLDLKPFSERGVEVSWFDYHGYPTYPQLWGPFTHTVSVLDLLFNCGHTARDYMRYTFTSQFVPTPPLESHLHDYEASTPA